MYDIEMNTTTTEIVDQVFDEFTAKILARSAVQADTITVLKEMHTRLIELLYNQYYNNVSRFMNPIDIDDVLCSSPPKSQMIRKLEPFTPQKNSHQSPNSS